MNDDNEFSFWNAEDNRVDYLDLETDDYLFPIVRKIFKSNATNKNLCSDEIQEQVHTECLRPYERMRIEYSEDDIAAPLEQPQEVMSEQTHNHLRDRLIEAVQEMNEISESMEQAYELPTMRA